MNRAVIIGAGKTGRGFIARLLVQQGIEIVFVDIDEVLINKLNISSKYCVHFFNNEAKKVEIENFKAYTWQNADISDIEHIFISVGAGNLNDVGERLCKVLNKKKQYYIIGCENSTSTAKILNNSINMKNVTISEAAVFCTTVEDEKLDILSEDYPNLEVNAKLLKGYNLKIPSIKYIDDFSVLMKRKLYTYNAASSIIAYFGWLKGYSVYSQAANDREISKILDMFYIHINQSICKEYGCDIALQEEFASLSKQKFCDKSIYDTVERNARNPLKKLMSDERIIMPMILMQKHSFDCTISQLTAAAAMVYAKFTSDASKSLNGGLGDLYENILIDICKLKNNTDNYVKIYDKAILLEEKLNRGYEICLYDFLVVK
ncbi:MAG: hypothetical protein PHY13_01275 [Clostridia bacterium]|jgi:mannitol-1-phosphate 5-dehydrogenase|nr:hypothetical protein [Clostridia bacterium]MDD4542389.1 hypothetical protein [Clostridia bacterium]